MLSIEEWFAYFTYFLSILNIGGGGAARNVVTSFEVIAERKTPCNTTSFHEKQQKKTNKNNKLLLPGITILVLPL